MKFAKFVALVLVCVLHSVTGHSAKPDGEPAKRKQEFVARWTEVLKKMVNPNDRAKLPKPNYGFFIPFPNGEWIMIVSATPAERDFNAVIARDNYGRISTSDYRFEAWEEVIEAFSKVTTPAKTLDSFYEGAIPYGLIPDAQ